MIQFNLLPDVKKEYVRAKRTKRLVISVSLVVSAAAVGVTVLMYTFVHIAQKSHIDRLTDDISSTTNQIQSTEDLETILTVQNQLSLLPGLHEQKPETSKLFGFIQVISPEQVRVSSLNVDFAGETMSMSGRADTIATVNKLVDNIKATTYVVSGSESTPFVFSDVSTDLSGGNDGATFTVRMDFAGEIFDNTQEVRLRVGTADAAASDSEEVSL